MLEQFKDWQLMLMGIGAVAFIVIGILLFQKWESKRATSYYRKRMKKGNELY